MEEDVKASLGLTEEELDELLGMKDYEEGGGGELGVQITGEAISSTTAAQLSLGAAVTAASITACVVTLSSPTNLQVQSLPLPGSVVLTHSAYLSNLALSAISGSAITAFTLLFLAGPIVRDMREEIVSSAEAGELEARLTMRQMKALAKKRGVKAGTMGKKELARKVVEEKRKMGWWGRLPFY
ncbi:hypothetical protein TrCOL_g10091 [Triparma columacea]|uniref:Uncharacterized protein n=1 Tax=Triparma columacea TaxID=722753 RepID=A0A9W7GDC8_9STRA|nr:hypothetical protein TrCOL_g10091 [Triparma columacea]